MKTGLALGSNLGDRLQNLQRARSYLIELSVNGWQLSSPIYETEPVGCPPNSPSFYNAVVEIEWGGAVHDLLAKLQAYEDAHGRDRNLPRNAARTIDLDILYSGDLSINETEFQVPHPRLTGRRFVLLPLSDLHPDLIIPGTGKTVAALLNELPDGGGQVKLVRSQW